MLFVKKVPWVSLLLLLLTYGVFGWLLSAYDRSWLLRLMADQSWLLWLIGDRSELLRLMADQSWLLWLIGAAFTLLVAISLIDPLAVIQVFYTAWLKSDARAFMSVIIGAFVAVIIIRWLEFFVRLLVLLSAATLARLDLQAAGYSKWQAFGILITISLSGFGLGLLGQQLLHHYSNLT